MLNDRDTVWGQGLYIGKLPRKRPPQTDTPSSTLKVCCIKRDPNRPTDNLGKTSEAKGDLARLQEVRRRREAAAAQREAEAAGA